MGIARLMPLTLAFVLALFAGAGSAAALDAKSAEAVVGIIERLNEDFGPVAFDEEEADRWFESDADKQGLIGKAGFDQERWKTAFDETIAGYLATLPDDQILAGFEALRQRVGKSSAVNAEQRQYLLAEIDNQAVQLGRIRAQGAAHAAIVRPLAPRLAKLVPLR